MFYNCSMKRNNNKRINLIYSILQPLKALIRNEQVEGPSPLSGSKLMIMKEAKDCQSIQEIRKMIDEIDYHILASFGRRHEFVSEIVKYKSGKDGIIAKERQAEVLQKRKEWAEQFGLDPELFGEIFETLINWNIKKELEIFRNK